MENTEIQTAESVALEKFVAPVEQSVTAAFTIPHPGSGVVVQVLDNEQYEEAGKTLSLVRTSRKELASYFKDAPADPNHLKPGEGLCYFTRKSWETANELFNRFDARLKDYDDRVAGAMKEYRAEQQRIATMQAEADAARERARLKAEADAKEAAAAAERQKAEEAAAEQRKKDEEERQRRLKLEKAAAQSPAALQLAQMRAEEEKARLAQEELDRRTAAEAEQKRQEEAAAALRRQAEAVTVQVPAGTVPKSSAVNVRKAWKGRVTDLNKLVAAIAAGKASVSLIEACESNINKLADANGGMNAPDGIVFYEDEITVKGRTKR